MTSLSSVGGTTASRISNLYASTQLLNALETNQSAMLKVEEQMSTGYQFQLPSQDPQAAAQVVALQRQLSQTTQYQANITTNNTYLNATDSALGSVTTALSSVRAVALSAIGSTATSAQRTAAVEQVQQTIQQLFNTANEQYDGRYLFSGSETAAAPFQQTASGNILYNGNDASLNSYSDAGVLFATNVTGDAAFGAMSAPVQGSTNLTPTVTFNTPLSDLNSGKGIAKGSIEISDGNHSSVVDLSQANTIGDVARMIENNPPAGDSLNVELTATGLQIQLGSGTGNLSVHEVGDGTTASDLGILAPAGVGTNPLVGRNLQPILATTTPIADLLGAPAKAVVHSAGSDNDVLFQSAANGVQDNNIQISYIDDGKVAAGHEFATYTPAAGAQPATLVVDIQSGVTTAAQVVVAVRAAATPLTATLDPIDDVNGGQGVVHASATATTAGGSGTVLDQTSGLQITNDNKTYTIDLSSAKTLQDVLNAINLSPAGMNASINATGNGIDICSRLSGSSFTIGENGGTTATQLGIRTLTTTTPLNQLNFGAVVTATSSSGTPSEATIGSPAADNGLILTSLTNGQQGNGYTVNVVDSGGPVGSESISYDAAAKSITFHIVPGSTTASALVNLFQNTPGARDNFSLALDTTTGANSGSGMVALTAAPATTSGGADAGIDFTIQRADGTTIPISIQGCQTIGDVIDKINTNADNGDGLLVAQLAPSGNGIQLVDNSFGSNTLTVSDVNRSTAAESLGLIPSGAGTASAATASGLTTPGSVASANVGLTDPTTGLSIGQFTLTANGTGDTLNGVQINIQDTGAQEGGETFNYDPSGRTITIGIGPATQVSDVLSLLQTNSTAVGLFSSTFTPSGSGSTSSLVTPPATPSYVGGGQAAVLQGSDSNPGQTDGVFTALLNLQTALTNNDPDAAQQAINLLDQSSNQVSSARAEMDARMQGLTVLQTRQTNNETSIQSSISQDYDVDFAQAASQFTQLQIAYQAALQTSAATMKMTLFSYL